MEVLGGWDVERLSLGRQAAEVCIALRDFSSAYATFNDKVLSNCQERVKKPHKPIIQIVFKLPSFKKKKIYIYIVITDTTNF